MPVHHPHAVHALEPQPAVLLPPPHPTPPHPTTTTTMRQVFRLGADPEAQLYFLEEASLLRLLRHPCVVGFAGVCVTDGNGIILMVGAF